MYRQVEVEPADKPKTAFTVEPLGFYQFVRMPIGLCNAGSSFQRMIEACMRSDNYLSVYSTWMTLLSLEIPLRITSDN